MVICWCGRPLVILMTVGRIVHVFQRIVMTRIVINIGRDEAALLVRVWIEIRVTGVGICGIMIIVRPLRKVISELVTSHVGARIFKVNDDQLLVLVGGFQQM